MVEVMFKGETMFHVAQDMKAFVESMLAVNESEE